MTTCETLMAEIDGAMGSEWVARSVELDRLGLTALCQFAREQAAEAYAWEDENDA